MGDDRLEGRLGARNSAPRADGGTRARLWLGVTSIGGAWGWCERALGRTTANPGRRQAAGPRPATGRYGLKAIQEAEYSVFAGRESAWAN